MNKKPIIFSAFAIFAFLLLNLNVEAKNKLITNDETIVFEEITYNEVVYENGKIKQHNKLNKDEYEKKVKEYKSKNEELILPMWYIPEPCEPYSPGCDTPVTPIKTKNITYDEIVGNNYCNVLNYTYCEANTRLETAYTTKKTKVSFNPDDFQNGKVYTELVWDVAPVQRSGKEYMSISWDNNFIGVDNSSIKATYFHEKFRVADNGDTYDHIVKANNTYTLSSNAVDKKDNGALLLTVQLLEEYGYNNTDEYIKITMEADFEVQGSYSSFRSINLIEFKTCYIHTYEVIDFGFDFTSGIEIEGRVASLVFNPSIFIEGDGPREQYIQFQMR